MDAQFRWHAFGGLVVQPMFNSHVKMGLFLFVNFSADRELSLVMAHQTPQP